MAQLTTPITTTKVANTLQVSTRDVGSLCTSDNINKWSKCKPIDDERPILTEDDWWAGTDGKCGFNITPVQIEPTDCRYSVRAILNAYNSNQWSYVKASKAFRLGDFRGYDHESICPFNYNYKKGDSYQIPAQSVGQITSGYYLFSVVTDDYNDLPDGNITIDDFQLGIYDGAMFYFKDCKLGAILLRGIYDLDSDIDSIATTPTGWLNVCDKPISSNLGESNDVEISVDSFMAVAGSNYRDYTYTLIGGLFFGYENNRFIPLPMDGNRYPVRHISFAKRQGIGFGSEIIQWSQEVYTPIWHDVKWVYTEDMVALKPLGASRLQIKLKVYYSNDDDITDPITLSSSNLRVICTGYDGFNRDGYYANIMTETSISGTTINIYPNQEDPTTVCINLGDSVPTYGQEGQEFHVEIRYTYGSGERTLFNMDFRATNKWQ